MKHLPAITRKISREIARLQRGKWGVSFACLWLLDKLIIDCILDRWCSLITIRRDRRCLGKSVSAGVESKPSSEARYLRRIVLRGSRKNYNWWQESISASHPSSPTVLALGSWSTASRPRRSYMKISGMCFCSNSTFLVSWLSENSRRLCIFSGYSNRTSPNCGHK